MEKIYDVDSYIWELESKVLECRKGKDGYLIFLEKTCFYPEGGGQPADHGFLGDIYVSDVQETGGQIAHYTKSPIPEGAVVLGRIEGDRRFSYMQHHTAEHIVSGLVKQNYHFDNVGFHMGKDCVTMDFNGKLQEDEIEMLERLANEAVYQNIAVKAEYPDEETLKQLTYRSKKELEGQVRIVTIPGYDRCACCGTHVKRTGELGLIKLIDFQSYKRGTRVSMLCAEKALAYCQMLQRTASSVSSMLCAKKECIPEAVTALKKEKEQQRSKIAGLYQRLFETEAEKRKKDKDAIVFEEYLHPNDARRFCSLLMEGREGISAVFFESDKGGYQYVLAGGKEEDSREIGKRLNAVCRGKGGGTKEMVQGSLSADKEEILSFLKGL